MTPRYGCVVLTAGRRPEDLRRAVASLLAQRDVGLDVVVVGNGCEPAGVPDGVRVLALERDDGIPAGRNAGVPQVGGELLFFLDDDAELAGQDALARVAALFAADPELGLVQLGPQPREPGGRRSRDWVPRLRIGDPRRPSESTVVWEGAVAIRRAAYDAVGPWPAEFRFVHEGVDLGWRLMDAGWRLRYAGDIAVLHPSPTGAAHGYSYYFGARNRVWLARRHLPLPLGMLFVASFALRTVPRLTSRRALQEAARGYRDGMRHSAGPRRRLRARTLYRMARAGRPPII
ncbi:MAG TPA: glycosyltransferase [Solirubrobacteraceae bacterium]|nr:glycosyltransferase [Solirubrobacteraceae bacterium]